MATQAQHRPRRVNSGTNAGFMRESRADDPTQIPAHYACRKTALPSVWPRNVHESREQALGLSPYLLIDAFFAFGRLHATVIADAHALTSQTLHLFLE